MIAFVKKYRRSLLSRIALLLLCLTSSVIAGMAPLSEDELSEVSGQALLNIDKYNHTTGSNANPYNFYKITMNSNVTTSVNIDEFVLRGQGGQTQIDIDNFSLNGGDVNGVSSARLKNPFIEFAFDGAISADNANNRKIIGIRVGAEEINGYLSFGNRGAVSAADNQSSVNGGGAIAANSGINMFRGYMKTAPLSGSFRTLDSAGGLSTTTPDTSVDSNGRIGPAGNNFTINGLACNDGGFFCAPTISFNLQNARMFFPSVTVPTTVVKASGIEVNTSDGNPISSFTIVTDDVGGVPNIPARITGVTDPVFGIVKIKMNASATLTNVKVKATIPQELRYIHKVKVSPTGGSGGFSLSAQNRDIDWLGDPATAKSGWWMSINNPVQMGNIFSTIKIPDTALQQIAGQASSYLNNTSNPNVPVPVCAICGLFGATLTPNVGNVPLAQVVPVVLPNSVDLGSAQNEIRNCWNGALGC